MIIENDRISISIDIFYYSNKSPLLYLLIVRFFDSIMCLNPCEDLSAKTLKCQTKKTAILISCFDWYVNRLKYIDKYLQDRGYSTLVLISDFNHSIKKNDTHLNYVKNLRYIHVPQYEKNVSIRRLWSHWCFTGNIRYFIENKKPDFVYCLVPPNSLVKGLVILKKKQGFRLVFDVIDLWPESFPKNCTNSYPFSVWRNYRDLYIDKADCIVLECEYYMRILSKYVDSDKVNVLRLIKKTLPIVNKVALNKDSINLCYLGSINSLIDIEKIFSIVRVLKKIKLVRVKIIGDGEKKDEYIKSLKKEDVDVEYYGKIFDDTEKQKIFADCHFGINIYKSSIEVGLTMKSVDYFQMGIPIINSISGDTREFVKKYGVGINMEDIEESVVVDFLNSMEDRKAKVVSVFNEFISEYNIENRLAFLDKLI